MTRDALLSAGQLDTQQAQQSFQRAAALLALAQEAIVVWDAATDAVAFWNRGAEAVYGWPRAEAESTTLRGESWVKHGRLPL